MIFNDLDQKTLSLYQPSSEVTEATRNAKDSYQKGHEILTRAWPELNDMSVIDRDSRDRKTFNQFVDENFDDPKEAWKWRGTRGMAGKRAIAMHAHLTSGFMFPMVSAQDENNDEDKGVSDFMRDMLIWMGDNSDYKESFLQLVTGMLTSPVTYLGAEYGEIFQKVREKTSKGYSVKEVLDEELSGFKAPVYGCQDVLITNAYVQNIQRQTCVIKQRHLDYADAQKKYGHNENWQFVQKGMNSILNEGDGLFYDVYDSQNSDSVKEVVCSWRGEDIEMPFVGGIYMGDENVENNPMSHRDNFNNPKYNVIPFGYHRISEHFFYFKSLMNQEFWNDQLLDAMWENYMNGQFMKQNPPIAITGEDDVQTSVMFPGAQFVTASKDTKVQSILPQDTSDGYRAIQAVEESIKEGTLSDTQMGQLPEASQKAFSVAKADQKAQIILSGIAQSMGISICQYGKLMLDIAIRFLSAAQLDDIGNIRYRQFVIPANIKGKNMTKVLRYGKDLMGRTMSKEQKKMYGIKLYEEAGGKEETKSITVVNPRLAARMKYLTRFEPDQLFSENRDYRQKIFAQFYPILRQDPLINAETLLRKMMYAFFRTEGDELIKTDNEMEEILKMAQQPKEPAMAGGRELPNKLPQMI